MEGMAKGRIGKGTQRGAGSAFLITGIVLASLVLFLSVGIGVFYNRQENGEKTVETTETGSFVLNTVATTMEPEDEPEITPDADGTEENDTPSGTEAGMKESSPEPLVTKNAVVTETPEHSAEEERKESGVADIQEAETEELPEGQNKEEESAEPNTIESTAETTASPTLMVLSTPVPTSTPAPTSAPTATPTPTPSSAPTPTSTPTEKPTPRLSTENKSPVDTTFYANPRFRVLGAENAYDLPNGFSAQQINSLSDKREFGLYFKFTPSAKNDGYRIERFDIVISDGTGRELFTDGFNQEMICQRGVYWYWDFFSLKGLFEELRAEHGKVIPGRFTMDIYFNNLWVGKSIINIKN